MRRDNAVTGPCIGVDVGGTSVRAALVGADGTVLDQRSADTPLTGDAAEELIAAMVKGLAPRASVSAVGLAIAGFVTADAATVMFAPHLAWRDAPVADRIAERIGIPVVMDHDVNCAAWAEHLLGAAVHSRVSLTIAIGTGIGAGLVIDGRLYRGAHGIAPELGHVAVIPGGRPCACGKRGCLERYCSGTALAATARELMLTAESPPLEAAAERGRLTGVDVAQAARAGDAVAREAFADLGRWLGRGVAMACDVLDPEIVVIGGGVSRSADLFLTAARQSLARELTGAGYRTVPDIVPARFADAASVVGAALLAADSVSRTV